MPDVPASSLFVETSVHVRRLIGTNEEQRRITRNYAAHRRISSTYVKAEYQQTLLRAAVDMYNVLASAEDVRDALARWNVKHGGEYKRGVSLLMIAICQDSADKEEALALLEQLIEVTIPENFREGSQEVSDATLCAAAHTKPLRRRNSYEWTVNFPPAEAPEGLRHFLQSQFPRLKKLHDALTSNEKHWLKVKAALSELLQDNFALGVRAWQRIADIIIALESPADGALYTVNLKHFQPLCEAIGATLHQELP